MEHPKDDRPFAANSPRDLLDLLNIIFDSTPSSTDLATLCNLLETSEEARQSYIQAIHLHVGLRRWAQSRGTGDVRAILQLQEDLAGGESQGATVHNELSSATDRSIQTSRAVAAKRFSRLATVSAHWPRNVQNKKAKLAATLTVAAALIVLLIPWHNLRRVHESPWDNSDSRERSVSAEPVLQNESYFLADTQQVVARIVSVSSDVKWDGNNRPSDFLLRFRTGDIVGVDAGSVQIEFSSGALLALDAPSVLQVTSTSSARLLKGTVIGRAGRSVDFTIVTPSATVVDIGTEFAVGVGEFGTDVSVFDGEVHVHGLWATEARDSSVRQLKSGMSARVDLAGFHQTPSSDSIKKLSDGRELLNSQASRRSSDAISLLDLMSGHDYSQHLIAGSIDASTGYWGRPSGFDPTNWNKTVEGSDKQFVQTHWNTMVDGVFIPGSDTREMQIDSDGHSVLLPPNTGTTWGPIWSRRRLELENDQYVIAESEHDYWGYGSLEVVTQRLSQTRDGLFGLHANVGITFDLRAVRNSLAVNGEIQRLKAVSANLDNSAQQAPGRPASKADLRIYVDGEARYSRLGFGRSDGDDPLTIPLENKDRFLTIVTTDADASIDYDHVVLVDPVLEILYLPTDAPQTGD